MLNPQGGVIDDLIIYFMSEDWFRLVVNAATRDKDLAWISEQAQAFAVEVKERPEFGMVAVQGPQARDKVVGLLREQDRVPVSKLLRFQRAATDEVSAFIEYDGPGQRGLERRHAVVHVLTVQIHAGLQAQGVARAQAAGTHAGGDERVPHRFGAAGRDGDLEPVLAGVTGARDQQVAHARAHERSRHAVGGGEFG